jgi:macrolide-specific efflux system membrane fusion protein
MLARPGTFRTLAIAPLLISTLLGCAAVGNDGQPTPIPTPVTVDKPTYRVERGDVVLQDSFTGTVVLVDPVALAFKVDGRLKDLNVKIGDAVKKDQTVGQLDISEQIRALNAAQFSLDQDEVKLANSRKITQFALQKAAIDLDMKQAALAKLKSTGSNQYDIQIAQDAVDLDRVQIDELKSSVDEEVQRQVARDQALVDQIKSDIDARTIKAPVDGVVTVIADKVAPGATVSAFQPIVQLGDPKRVEISVNFLTPESDLSVGQNAVMTVPRIHDKTFVATLRKPEGSTSGSAGDQAARFTVDSNAVELIPGETVYLSVVLKDEKGVLWLPPNGIRTFMGRNFVVVREGGVEKRLDVEVGTKTNDRVVVRQGLTEGQVVIGP